MKTIICDKCDKIVKTGEFTRYQVAPSIADPTGHGPGFELCSECNSELMNTFLKRYVVV